jgi:hypothetical protein
MSLPEGAHADLLREAIEAEAHGQRALLAGERDEAEERLRAASGLYRASWEAAPPRSYGRLIGMLKAAVIAGDAGDAATYAREQLAAGADSPPACYALAIAALAAGDDRGAAEAAAGMRGGSPPMVRAADAITAVAAGDRAAYADAIRAIVADFEGRQEHLTGVPIADTALMLERLAGERGMAAGVASPLLPR